MSTLHPTVERVTARVIEKSRETRRRYLDLMEREGERHGDRRAEFHLLGVLGSEQQREERVVARLGGPGAAVAGGLQLRCLCTRSVQIGPDAPVDLHVGVPSSGAVP